MVANEQVHGETGIRVFFGTDALLSIVNLHKNEDRGRKNLPEIPLLGLRYLFHIYLLSLVQFCVKQVLVPVAYDLFFY